MNAGMHVRISKHACMYACIYVLMLRKRAYTHVFSELYMLHAWLNPASERKPKS